MAKGLIVAAAASVACCWSLHAAGTAFVQILPGSSQAAFGSGSVQQAAPALTGPSHVAASRQNAGLYTPRSQSSRGPRAAGASEATALITTPSEGYMALAEKGAYLVKEPFFKLFLNSFLAGCFVGFGGLLAMALSGNLQGIAANNPGIQTFAYAFLFPVNLFIIQLTGATLFTGTTATTIAGWLERKLSKRGFGGLLLCLRAIGITWLGNLAGGIAFAAFATACGLNVGPTAELAIKVTAKKTHLDFFSCFLRGIGCNWMVCIATLMATMAQDTNGKYLSILLPISTFVACGFEHLPANAFALPFGIMAGSPISVWTMLTKNLLPVTLGNWFAGSIIVALGYSFIYGRLSQPREKKAADKAAPELTTQA